MRALRCVYPKESSFLDQTKVSVEFSLNETYFTATFEVTAPYQTTNPALSKSASQWGLWEWDVVEIFIAPHLANEKPAKYFEFNVSPLGQFFELEIFRPRVDFNKNFRSGFIPKVSVVENKWTATLAIALTAIGFKKGMTVSGNAFACLGKESERTYWSLFTPLQEQPDFHILEHFKPLLY